jgi:hypothetical protein
LNSDFSTIHFLGLAQAGCECSRERLDVRFLHHAVVLAGYEMDVDIGRQAAPAAIAAR